MAAELIFELVTELLGAAAECAFNGVTAAVKKKYKRADFRKKIAKAADIIQNGGVVAFPTETVYGLGADAFNATAVERVYAAKGRPGDNPLILHVANVAQFLELVEAPPAYALALAKAYWPGPLTLIAKKKYHLPGWVGGHPFNATATVGVRIPKHPAALALIQAAGCPIAAPSANKSGRPSPTSAKHVKEDFATGEVDMILDGDISNVGIESTVVDVTGDFPVILRPGAITREMIEKTTKLHLPNAAGPAGQTTSVASQAPRSPGMKYRHYAPKAPMVILQGAEKNIAAYILQQCKERPREKIGVYVREVIKKHMGEKLPPNAVFILFKSKPETAAQHLFNDLRQFDTKNVSAIFAEALPETGVGVAIMDRMRKAAEGNVLDV